MVNYTVTVSIGVALFAILALGMNIQWGWGGLLNLSFIGFVGLGGYVSSFFTLPPASVETPPHWLGLRQPFIVGALVAMVVCGLFAAGMGAIALRKLRTDYFAIVTLSCYTMLYQFVGSYRSMAGGWSGIYGIPQPLSHLFPSDNYDYYYFFLGMCIAILVVVFAFCRALQRGPFGRTLRAIREDGTAASVFGRNVYVFKLKAFVLGSAIAGLGGALTATWVGAYAPGSWTSAETFLILACVMLGGTGSNIGVVIGAVLVDGVITEAVGQLPNLPGGQASLQQVRLILFGLLILAVIRWRPRGIVPERRDIDQPAAQGWRARIPFATRLT
jgi:branched-chain amino acid transport system permease protein